jgi:chaperone required for assembly of F1-ATPase
MKRFYRQAETVSVGSGYGVALDGRPVRTPAKRDLKLPTAALAAAIAAEWNSQEADIRPARMPLTQLANTAIDRVNSQRDLIVRQVADYAGTDLVCYRAARPPELTAR